MLKYFTVIYASAIRLSPKLYKFNLFAYVSNHIYADFSSHKKAVQFKIRSTLEVSRTKVPGVCQKCHRMKKQGQRLSISSIVAYGNTSVRANVNKTDFEFRAEIGRGRTRCGFTAPC
jgi:hypothetical protein